MKGCTSHIICLDFNGHERTGLTGIDLKSIESNQKEVGCARLVYRYKFNSTHLSLHSTLIHLSLHICFHTFFSLGMWGDGHEKTGLTKKYLVIVIKNNQKWRTRVSLKHGLVTLKCKKPFELRWISCKWLVSKYIHELGHIKNNSCFPSSENWKSDARVRFLFLFFIFSTGST